MDKYTIYTICNVKFAIVMLYVVMAQCGESVCEARQ
nr:MAG TPA: hypothetical protein [Caudoviricetes sp.]